MWVTCQYLWARVPSRRRGVGGGQAILRDAATGWLLRGADPRRNGYALG
jgi:hypothetical protein